MNVLYSRLLGPVTLSFSCKENKQVKNRCAFNINATLSMERHSFITSSAFKIRLTIFSYSNKIYSKPILMELKPKYLTLPLLWIRSSIAIYSLSRLTSEKLWHFSDNLKIFFVWKTRFMSDFPFKCPNYSIDKRLIIMMRIIGNAETFHSHKCYSFLWRHQYKLFVSLVVNAKSKPLCRSKRQQTHSMQTLDNIN